jgi:hypothetical protein
LDGHALHWKQFALIEASYTTIRLLQTFKGIEKREDSELKVLLTITRQ